jgi:solute carrier family 25 (mitochondrial phosphate transporter), member 3
MAPLAGLPGLGFGKASLFSTAMATMTAKQPSSSDSTSSMAPAAPAKVVAASVFETPIVPYTPAYYYTCAVGGVASCGLTHMGVTPLDVVKCNMQTNPGKYRTIGSGFSTIVAEQGVAGLFRGWVPTLLGYSAQGACKFGLYEYFKKCVHQLAVSMLLLS